MTTYFTQQETPLCTLRLTSDGEALTGIYLLPDHRHAPEMTTDWEESPTLPIFQKAATQLAEYFAGQRTTFSLPLAPTGTAFQKRVWAELIKIPYGQTISYGELARRIGNPSASRAVGLANGKNPLSIIVPCHRVIGASGKLTGYGGGLARKEALLSLEAPPVGAAVLES
ncbi:methylated-DNA--[protein]-cysteine S-methyltransferase [Armatimonas sp.]|uniref:methylated-DNA--[protein]-cysteine S-methyltransferase n=1 Tax=Armatimonas sp. TaxID=1872638 RepID=UPI00286B31D0|nr:methylated-DNA--[protein]-cysteine S-methyltransferase [Armatimonas sp.]